jgi:hypothetical protein
MKNIWDDFNFSKENKYLNNILKTLKRISKDLDIKTNGILSFNEEIIYDNYYSITYYIVGDEYRKKLFDIVEKGDGTFWIITTTYEDVLLNDSEDINEKIKLVIEQPQNKNIIINLYQMIIAKRK